MLQGRCMSPLPNPILASMLVLNNLKSVATATYDGLNTYDTFDYNTLLDK